MRVEEITKVTHLRISNSHLFLRRRGGQRDVHSAEAGRQAEDWEGFRSLTNTGAASVISLEADGEGKCTW